MVMNHIKERKLPKTKTDRYVVVFGSGFNAGTCVITLPDPEHEPDRFWFELRLVNVYGRGVQAQLFRDQLKQLNYLIWHICDGADKAIIMESAVDQWRVLPLPPPPAPIHVHTIEELAAWVKNETATN